MGQPLEHDGSLCPISSKKSDFQYYSCKEMTSTKDLSERGSEITPSHQVKLFSSVQSSCSVVPDSLQPHGLAHTRPPCPSLTPVHLLSKLMCIESVMPSNHLILCRPLLLPSVFPSIRVNSNESVYHIKWPKYWSFSFSISPSNEYSGLISFSIDCFDLLVVQGTHKSFL